MGFSIMKRIILFILTLLCLITTGVNSYSYWQSRLQVSISAASYQGPGDIVSSASVWYGLRCYNSAYTGNVADVYAPADATHTLLTCSSGGTINQTLQALSTTCAVSCTVKTLYDQTVSGLNLTQATIANRPTFIINCLGSLPCMSFDGSATFLNNVSFSTISQPYTFSAVNQGTIPGGITFGALMTANSNSIGWYWSNSSNLIQFNWGAAPVTATATNSTWHNFQFVADNGGGNSNVNVDGTGNALNLASGAGVQTNFYLGSEPGPSNVMLGKVGEIGIWPIGFSSGQKTSMCHNQFIYWGTPTSC
jgi:hypothetical protein